MPDPDKVLQKLVLQAGDLYTLPAVAVEVLQLTDDPKVDAYKLKNCIENDPALSCKILRVVNSSLFGLSREISDLNQALALLGSKPLKLLVLGFNLPDAFFAHVAGDELARYWRTTLTKAVAAREISQQLWSIPGDDAFIAALLQDLGLLVMIQSIGQPYVNFLGRVRAEEGDLCALERSAIGMDHTQLTSGLLDRWGLPRLLVQAVAARPETPDQGDSSPLSTLSRILHLVDLMTHFLVDRQYDVLPEFMETGRKYRQLSVEQVTALISDLQEKVEQLAEVLSLELPAGLDYRDVLNQSHRQLAAAATDAASELVRNHRQAEAQRREQLLRGPEAAGLSSAVNHWYEQEHAPPPPNVSAAIGNVATSVAATAAATLEAASATLSMAKDAAPADHPIAIADDDPALLGRLNLAVAACRQARCPLSLLLVEIDNFADAHFAHGPEAAASLLQFVESKCDQIDHPSATCIQVREARFAVILPDCDRQQIGRLGKQLVRSFREHSGGGAQSGKPAVTVSAGAASVTQLPKNFPPQDLVEAADRCLYGTQASGGDGLKSIEIY